MKNILLLFCFIAFYSNLYSENISFSAYNLLDNEPLSLDSIKVTDLEFNITTIIYNNNYEELGVTDNDNNFTITQISANQVYIKSPIQATSEYRIISIKGDIIAKGNKDLLIGDNYLTIIPDNITGVNILQLVAGNIHQAIKINSELYTNRSMSNSVSKKLLNNHKYNLIFYAKGYYPKLVNNIELSNSYSVGMSEIQSKYKYISGSIECGVGITLKGTYNWSSSGHLPSDNENKTSESSKEFVLKSTFTNYYDESQEGYFINNSYIGLCNMDSSYNDTVYINYAYADYPEYTTKCITIIFDNEPNLIKSFTIKNTYGTHTEQGGMSYTDKYYYNTVELKNITYSVDNGKLSILLNAEKIRQMQTKGDIQLSYESLMNAGGSASVAVEDEIDNTIYNINDEAFIKIELSE